MDDPKNVMQLCLRPAQVEKPIFCHDFLSEVGAHHIYEGTGFCHNYRHRSVLRLQRIYNFFVPYYYIICFGCLIGSWAQPIYQASGRPWTHPPLYPLDLLIQPQVPFQPHVSPLSLLLYPMGFGPPWMTSMSSLK